MEDHQQVGQTLTPSQVRARFREAGISVAEWARQNRYSTGLVYHVLSGRNKASRGQSHRIAVALGLKEGKSPEIQELSFSASDTEPTVERGASSQVEQECP